MAPAWTVSVHSPRSPSLTASCFPVLGVISPLVILSYPQQALETLTQSCSRVPLSPCFLDLGHAP